MSVTAVTKTAKGVSYVIDRPSDGLKFSVEVVVSGAAVVSSTIGAVVTATVLASGVALVSLGKALEYCV